MSYHRAWQAIHLQPTDGLAQQENLDHPAFIAECIGRDPWDDPRQAYVDAYRALDVDWVLGIPRGGVSRDAFKQASSVDLGDGARMTEWGLSGSYWREEHPFADVEAVLRYDPLENVPHLPYATVESGVRNLANVRETQALLGRGSLTRSADVEAALHYDPLENMPHLPYATVESGVRNLANVRETQSRLGRGSLTRSWESGSGAMVSAMRYPTLFTACIQAFGWPLFMTAAAAEPDRFAPILRGFADISRRILAEWAAQSWPLILVHDDIAMQHGLVFHPQWYREQIYPLYEYILEPVLANPDVRVCFVSDGDYSTALPDLVSLGFHGFFVNPNMDLAALARAYGQDHFLVGNVDTAVLTFGRPDDIRQHVAQCVEAAKPCAGHFTKAMGDLPHNIPMENIRAYFDACACYR
jgi:hypothetical protein